MPELGPLPPPAGPPPGPGLPAAPDRPPPPLPAVDSLTDAAARSCWGPVVDPTLDAAEAVARPARLHARATVSGTVVSLLHTRAPMRHTPLPGFSAVDEAPLTVTAVRVPVAALPDAPAGTDLLGRLRVLHRELLPGGAHHPLDARWDRLGGQPAALDLLGRSADGPATGFSLATPLGSDGGLVAVASAPPGRTDALHRVALPLACLARADGDGIGWAGLPGWADRDELQIRAATVLAHAVLQPLPPGTPAAGWGDVVLCRTPSLRDRRPRNSRAVSVAGLDAAWSSSFDRVVAGRGRVLTTVVTGTAGRTGFVLVADVPFEGSDPVLDLDDVLDLVEVRPEPAPAPAGVVPPSPAAGGQSVGSPTAVARSTVEFTLPPVPPGRVTEDGGRPRLRGPRDRYLDAAIDRVMVAAVDIADADPDGPTIPPRPPPGQLSDVTAHHVAAVRSVLDAVLMRGWGPPLPWHGRMDVEALALARVGRWRRIANLLVAATRPSAGTVLDDEVWVTARLVATAAAEARQARVDERSGLAGVLDRVRRGLEDPDGAWDESLATVLVTRPPRYRLRTGFEPGSGRLLWAATPETVARWGQAVDHFDLPVPLSLARHVQWLVERHDLGSRRGTRRFFAAEFAAYREDYEMTVDDLRRALGPAYAVEERAGIGRRR